MITLKPNTYYKTRGGHKAFVGFKRHDTNEHVGYIDGVPGWQVWDEYGHNYTSIEHFDKTDLVAEWTESKLRPWEHKEVPLGAWMREKTVGLPSLIVAITIGGLWRGHGDAITFDYALAHYEHSTDSGKTWLPCGVME